MQEPSILDFLKSKLNPEPPKTVEVPEPKKRKSSKKDAPPPPPPPAPSIASGLKIFPWRSLLAIGLALFAQVTLNPPRENIEQVKTLGAGIYFFAFLFLLWALLAKEWTFESMPEEHTVSEPMTIYLRWVWVALPLGAAAFLLFTNNLFTPFNVTLWALGTAFLIRAMMLRTHSPETHEISHHPRRRLVLLIARIVFGVLLAISAYTGADWSWLFFLIIFIILMWANDSGFILFTKRAANIFTDFDFNISFTRTGLILLALTALILFYRFYDLSGTLAEPFSDHAEKLLDVYDVTQGNYEIFFPRNTGREAFQMYLSAGLAIIGFGLTFMTLKVGTVLCGLATLPYIYLLAKEISNKRAAMFALFFAGIAYWLNVISRVGLRFPIYPLFVAPTLYYMIRGLRSQNRNDFIWAGLFLGIGLHGYSPFRFVPFLVAIGFALFILHKQSAGARTKALWWFGLIALFSFFVFLPLGRYALENPDMFSLRAFSRLTGSEQPLPAPAYQIFLSNFWKAYVMFFWDNGGIWVHSIPGYPALDTVSAALYFIGTILVLYRYIKTRHWLDLFLLISVPMLMMPSILSLAFPGENPSLNRTGGAAIPVFILIGLALDSFLTTLNLRLKNGRVLATVLTLFLMVWSMSNNYSLVFTTFSNQFRAGAWNTSDMGKVIQAFVASGNPQENAFVVPSPHWVDTRLVGVWAGYPTRDFAKWRDELPSTLDIQGAKLFIIRAEDLESIDALKQLYPQGSLSFQDSPLEGKDFYVYFVPENKAP